MDAYLEELHDRGATDWIVQHAQSPEDAERLVADGTRDLRLRAAVLHPGRPRARRPPRLGAAGRRDGARLKPFRLAVPEAALDDLRERLRRTRWPEAETVDDWSQGVPLAYLQELCRVLGRRATTGGRPRRG